MRPCEAMSHRLPAPSLDHRRAVERRCIFGLWALAACGTTDGESASGADATATASTSSTSGSASTDVSASTDASVTSATETSAATSSVSSGETSADETSTSTSTGPTTGLTSETGTTTAATTSADSETGTTDPGALTCDGSPAWDDPFGDGSLRLSGQETLGVDAGPNDYAWICVREAARINVCESTLIRLDDPVDTVIGGDGIGPLGDEKVMITIESPHPIDLFVFVDVTGPPVDVWIDAPQACVTVTSKGQSELGFGGTSAGILVSTVGALTLNGYTGTGMGRCPFEAEFTAGGGVLAPPECPME